MNQARRDTKVINFVQWIDRGVATKLLEFCICYMQCHWCEGCVLTETDYLLTIELRPLTQKL